MTSFKQYYRCYSVSQTGQHDHLESGDKILLPASVLARLSTMLVEYPLLFRLKNLRTEKVSHCGVMEFSADEGTALLPDWVMDNMELLEGDLVEVDYASLEKATFVRLQPHKKAFVELSNPKAVLEKTLRGFSCLTVGDTIVIDYLGSKFSIDVCETKPDDRAVTIIETDCEVDFSPPLDYKEPERPAPEKVWEVEKPKEGSRAVEDDQEAKFRPFTGAGRRLDGGLISTSTEATRDVNSADVVQNDVVMGSGCCESSGLGGRRKAGKLVFGGSADQAVKNSSGESGNRKVLKDNNNDDGKGKTVKEEDNVKGFKPFSGKSYRLSD